MRLPCSHCHMPLTSYEGVCHHCKAPVVTAAAQFPDSSGQVHNYRNTPNASIGPQGHYVSRKEVLSKSVTEVGMPLCLGCGRQAPIDRSGCEVCAFEFGPSPPRVWPNPDGTYWAAVRCSFNCPVCHKSSPLNHLDADGRVLCLHCAHETPYDVRVWNDGIAHAHATADLAGPNRTGRFPEAGKIPSLGRADQRVGGGLTTRTHELNVPFGAGQCQLSVEAAPGHPLCAICRSPYRLVGRTANAVTLACSSCGVRRTGTLPEGATNQHWSPAGVFSESNDASTQEVRVSKDAGGAITLACPACSAPLHATGDCTFVTCSHCNVASRIAPTILAQMGLSNAKMTTWWILLEGLSPARQEKIRVAQENAAPPQAVPNPGSDQRTHVMMNHKQAKQWYALFALALFGGWHGLSWVSERFGIDFFAGCGGLVLSDENHTERFADLSSKEAK